MNNCKTCAHSVFDERWGEYKCAVYKHRIYNIDLRIDCRDHKRKVNKGKEQVHDSSRTES